MPDIAKLKVNNKTYDIKDSVSRDNIDNLTNDLNNNYTKTSDLSEVALTGSYNDLSNKPTIPTKTSDLTNDSGYITDTDYATTSKGGTIKIANNRAISMSNGVLQTQIKDYATYQTSSDYIFIGKKTLENVITGKGLIDKNVNDLTNYTLTSSLSTVATSGSYNDLTNKPTIPTKTSELTNDSKFVTTTNYATNSVGGVIKSNTAYATQVSGGSLASMTRTYNQYQSDSNWLFVSKGTLENVLTGKGLVAPTYDSSTETLRF